MRSDLRMLMLLASSLARSLTRKPMIRRLRNVWRLWPIAAPYTAVGDTRVQPANAALLRGATQVANIEVGPPA